MLNADARSKEELSAVANPPNIVLKRASSRSFRDRVCVAVGAGLLVLLVSGWMLFRSPTVKADAYRYLQCPKCGLELSYNPVLSGKPCPKCVPRGPDLIPSKESITSGGRAMNPRVRWITFGMICLTVVLGVSWFVLTEVKKTRSEKEQQEVSIHCQCPNCNKKLRYGAKRGGCQGICPKCKQSFTFPNVVVID